ncbi:hypothetical protein K6W16_15000 [Burkholderia dolosa]|uniref:Uncharacterized protein n=1 Tax=Burkholderia dolosa TaxID=152500 RepID=A0A892IHL9_9BURK|nr:MULTISPECIES: hypothetical protein [Burkholderia]MBR8421002.1 hypothetical protein [Burkholderia dolosa]MBY4658712.1 hypothetical protein [Burkholderia dolosa]MBY4688888.1 hypothetical protein [Burkholderia dolosa]MBY4781760.1 hypothetical protein [Burkholderia dolosa]MBY4786702.1 hypothetical protein [Burkholderia dolosa]
MGHVTAPDSVKTRIYERARACVNEAISIRLSASVLKIAARTAYFAGHRAPPGSPSGVIGALKKPSFTFINHRFLKEAPLEIFKLSILIY